MLPIGLHTHAKINAEYAQQQRAQSTAQGPSSGCLGDKTAGSGGCLLRRGSEGGGVAESMFMQQESLQTQKCIVLLGHYTIWGTGRVSKSSASVASPYPTELPSALVSGQTKIMRCPSPPRRTVDSSSRKRSRRTETAMLQWRRAWQTVRGDAWHPEVQSCLSARK